MKLQRIKPSHCYLHIVGIIQVSIQKGSCIVVLSVKRTIMARIAGIKIEKDKQGNARYARIDLKKYDIF